MLGKREKPGTDLNSSETIGGTLGRTMRIPLEVIEKIEAEIEKRRILPREN